MTAQNLQHLWNQNEQLSVVHAGSLMGGTMMFGIASCSSNENMLVNGEYKATATGTTPGIISHSQSNLRNVQGILKQQHIQAPQSGQ
jgi:hypothetical protein